MSSQNMKQFVNRLDIQYGTGLLKGIAENKFFFPFDIMPWQEELRKHQFAVGSRIHGCITAMQSSVPTKVITIDSRVRELAEFIGLPRVSDASLLRTDLYEEWNYLDFDEFNRKYKEGYKRFSDFMSNNKISYDLDNRDYWENQIRNITWNAIELFDSREMNAIKDLCRPLGVIRRKSARKASNLFQLR